MHCGKRFPFVDLLIVTMITYGRLSLSGVVGDHPGETTIRKGRSMNIQLMNVAVDIIEQRLAPLANVLTRNNHITSMRDSFALAILPGLFAAAAYPAADLSANYWPGGADCRLRRQRQSRQAVPSAGTALRFNRVSGFSAVYRLSRDCGEQCLSRRYGDIYRPDIQHLFH